MNKDFPLRRIIRMQDAIIFNMRNALQDLRIEAERNVNLCRENGYNISRLTEIVLERAEKSLFYHELQFAKILEAMQEVPKGQKRLQEVN